MRRIHAITGTLLATLMAASVTGVNRAAPATRPTTAPSPYAAWKNGPPTDPSYFPIGVWVQSPRNARRYKEAGVNLYVGLYRGPDEAQLRELKDAGVRTICSQNANALKFKDDPTIIGWLQRDEPDNAQPLRGPDAGKGKYGPPVKPEQVVETYQKLRAADPTRPVMLNLGQGVANDKWVGRGPGAKREDYLTYVLGGDIVSFDFYPVGGEKGQDGNDRLPLVAKGVQHLNEWTGGKRVVWAILECSRIHNTDHKPTAKQLRAEVWMALVHGAKGIVWFAHQFDPEFREASVLDDPELLAPFTEINRQIHVLAPVLNSPSVKDGVKVTSSDPKVPVATMVKWHAGATYLFAVSMANAPTRATFEVRGVPSADSAAVLGEGRQVEALEGRITDGFEPYGVHIYRVRPEQ